MKNKLLKLSLVLLGGVLLVFAATLVYINSQIEPEKIKKMIVSTIESNLVGSKASIASLDYSLGQKITFRMETLQIKHQEIDFVSVEKVKVYIPLISILTSGGVIDVNFSGSALNIIKDKNGDLNINKIFKKEKSSDEKVVKIEVPKFLEKSKVNLKITDTNLNYKVDEQVNLIEVKKVIFKNINLQKTTAFEVSTSINMNLKDKKVQSDVTLIGEIPLKDLLDKKPANIDLMIRVSKSNLGEFKLNASKHRGVLTYINQNNVSLKMRSDIDETLSGDIEVNITKDTIGIKKIDYVVKTEGLIKTLKLDEKLKETKLQISDLEIGVKGGLQYNITTGSLNPNLLIMTTKPFNLVTPKLELTPSFNLNLLGRDVNLNLSAKLLEQGEISADIKSKIDFNNLEELSPVQVDLVAKAINLKTSKISIVELANSKEEQIPQNEVSAKLDLSFLEKVPEIKLNTSLEESNINGIQYTVESSISYLNRKLSIKNFLLNFPEAGKVNSNNFEVDLSKNEQVSFSGEMISSINLIYFDSLLPTEIEKVKGQLNSNTKVKGEYSEGIDYKLDGKLTIKNGVIKDFNIYDFLEPIIKKYPFLKSEAQKNKEVTTSFNLLSTKYLVDKKKIDLSELNFTGENNEFNIKGKGTIELVSTKNSRVVLDAYVKTLAKEFKSNTGKSNLPLLLEGVGFALIPNVNYTTGRVFKRVKNTAVKKAKQKINKQIKKEKKKAEEKLKKEAEKLLKGIKL